MKLWIRWVAANAIAEAVGLGGSLALIAWVVSAQGDHPSVAAIVFGFVFTVACGAFEATLVGLAQWWALHPWFPGITRRAWWLATLAGALVAYALGYLPSTIMSLGEPGASTPGAEPPQVIILLLAAGLGAVGGAVLSAAQWRVLRKAAQHAGWWIPANMLAWLVGMPLIFWGIDAAQKGQPLWQAVAFMVAVLFFTGTVVGAIHGLFLVRMVPHTAQ